MKRYIFTLIVFIIIGCRAAPADLVSENTPTLPATLSPVRQTATMPTPTGPLIIPTATATDLQPNPLPTPIESQLTPTPTPIPTPIRTVSPSNDPRQANAPSGDPEGRPPGISADGSRIVFVSQATNLVPDDTHMCPSQWDLRQGNCLDVFIHDQETESTRRVSVASDDTQADGESFAAALSADGRWVAFRSRAGNLSSDFASGCRQRDFPQNCTGIFVHDLETGQTELLLVISDNGGLGLDNYLSLSADGRYVAFAAAESTLIAGVSGANFFVYDRQRGEIRQVQTDVSPVEAECQPPSRPSSESWQAFFCPATDNIFVHHLETDEMSLVSASDGTLTADGRLVVFASEDTTLVANDTHECQAIERGQHNCADIFLYDLEAGQIARISNGIDGAQSNGDSLMPSISADGRIIAFMSNADNLVAGDGQSCGSGTAIFNCFDIFAYDRDTESIRRVSVSSEGEQANRHSRWPRVSADGRWVTFVSWANNLVPGDSNGDPDIFIHNLETGKTERVNIAMTDQAAAELVATAARIIIGSWSPDSTWLTYWRFTAEEVAVDYTYPPGTLHFFNEQTGQDCVAPEPVAYSYSPHLPLTWQADGTILLQTSNGRIQGIPCHDDFALVTVDSSPGSVPSNLLSPTGQYQVSTETTYNPDETVSVVTTITAVTPSMVKNVVEWKAQPGLGEFGPGGQWVTDDLFLIHETLDQGPLLVLVGQGVIEVAPTLFNRSITSICPQNPCDTRLAATAVAVNQSAAYRLILYGRGGTNNDLPSILLYESDKEQVRELPFRHQGGFAPDGQSLVLYESQWDEAGNRETYKLWLLPLNTANATAVLLLEQNTHPLPLLWSPDGRDVAFSAAGGLIVFSSPGGQPVNRWQASATFFPGAWSPDGRVLAAKGIFSANGLEGLFIINKDAE